MTLQNRSLDQKEKPDTWHRNSGVNMSSHSHPHNSTWNSWRVCGTIPRVTLKPQEQNSLNQESNPFQGLKCSVQFIDPTPTHKENKKNFANEVSTLIKVKWTNFQRQIRKIREKKSILELSSNYLAGVCEIWDLNPRLPRCERNNFFSALILTP